jgi:germination protein M
MSGKISRLTLLSIIAILIVVLSACRNKEGQPPAKPTRVSATDAYKRFFGPAPTTDKGSCFAFVIYFPSKKSPGKVVPFPFFTFDEGSIKKVAVERFLSGMDVGSYRGEFLQPFPAGTHLLGISEEKGSVIANFSRELTNPDGKSACGKGGGADALALTLAQFSDVREVRVAVEGKDGVIPLSNGCTIRQPLAIDEAAVQEPGPPRLLEVAALKEKGAKEIEAVHAYFDRPLDIKEITFSDKNGQPFAGEVYQSVFDMAAVLKPKNTSLFTAGLPIKVRWKVIDKVGRQAQGENTIPLEIKEH